jgi:hypothetical protein
VCLCGLAQNDRPVAFAVDYAFGKEDGIPAGNAFTVMDQLEDGSTVVRLYGKQFLRITPTGAKPVYMGSSLKSFLITEMASTNSGKGIFFAMNGGLIKLIGDSLQAYGPTIKMLYAEVLPSGNHFVSLDSAGFAALRLFDGAAYKPIPLPPQCIGNTTEEVTFTFDVRDGGLRLVSKKKEGRLHIFAYQESQNQLILESTYDKSVPFRPWRSYGADSLIIYDGGSYSMYYPNRQKPSRKTTNRFGSNGTRFMQALDFATNAVIKDYRPAGLGNIPISFTEMVSYIQEDRFYNSIYLGMQTNPHRIFSHIQQYPQLYAPGHSLSTSGIAQSDDGTLFFTSYTGHATALKQGQLSYIDVGKKQVLPGAKAIGNKAYTFAELAEGILQLSDKRQERVINSNKNYGYFITLSRNEKKVLTGMGNYRGIGIISRADMEAGRPNWTFIDSSKGLRLLNVLTVTEDLQGRLWFGRISQGWGVYDPHKDTAVTYLRQEGTSSFGAMATYCDEKGLVWLGGSDGIWVVDGNKKGSIQANDAQRLQHPLLPAGTEVVSIAPWGKYLVFNAGQKLLLLNREHFYKRQKDILNGKIFPTIGYINPQELALNPQAQWNQNCILVDRMDSSLWMGANTNVYHIDLKKWFSLTRPHATPVLFIAAGTDTLHQKAGNPIKVAPTQNSLSFNLQYQTTDNLPRFFQVALVAKDDSIRWSNPSTETHFEAWNKQTGEYQFLVRIIEHDGTINEFALPITIRRFLWQQWWFWLLLSLAVGGACFYAYYLYKQKQLAEANAARIAAEAESLKAEQQRQLTSMQVKSLSTQFRPHFILNALNTVGAQLYDKPEVDAVLGQLGDSIGIIFKNAQSGAIAHPLSQEWRLVTSVIKIKQLELQNTVTVHLNVPEDLLNEASIQVPMGILQIPVENALVHGLRNKETGPKDLWITATQSNEGELCVTVLDNGIGRKAAAVMGNYRSNGVGTRNIQAILDLLNPFNEKPITIQYRDEPIEEDGKTSGTEVTICIPKNYLYER